MLMLRLRLRPRDSLRLRQQLYQRQRWLADHQPLQFNWTQWAACGGWLKRSLDCLELQPQRGWLKFALQNFECLEHSRLLDDVSRLHDEANHRIY